MESSDRFADAAGTWETGKLGREEEFVKQAAPAAEKALDEALCLQMISVRLQNKLIDDLKFIATAHGIGYQPLMRDVLSRFVVHEKKKIIQDAIERKKQEMELEKQEQEQAAAKKKVA